MSELKALRETCKACKKCVLHETRTNIVFGSGGETARIMFIGEAPGENEDLSGEPFVGKGGKLLDDLLEIIEVKRDDGIYITNIVKCRPPKNRAPLDGEQKACIGYLREQISLINPKIIVCLGRIAAKVIIKDDFKITAEHGLWFERDGRRVMAIFHPAALLRDPNKRPETFADLKMIQLEINGLAENVS